jgi:uncharacterized protein (TIGR02145 family)
MTRGKFSLFAVVFMTAVFLISCGEHGFLEELLAGNSSSSEEASSSPSQGTLSSSSRGTAASSSSRGNSSVVRGSFTDSRDSEVYETVRIGGQTWMARNLNYNVNGKCYGEDGPIWDINTGLITLTASEIQSNCTKYGRLYNWEAANNACPGGWHLPSTGEWGQLFFSVDGGATYYESATAGRHLKATSGWPDDYRGQSGNGQDTYEFTALPGGAGWPDDDYDFVFPVGYSGYWWSDTEYDSRRAYFMAMSSEGDEASLYGESFFSDKILLYSVRCVQN